MAIEAPELTVSIEKPGAWARRLTITVPADRIAREKRQAVERLSKRLRVPGFRAGKVPAAVMEKKYGAAIEQETVEKVIGDAYRATLKSEGLEPMAVASLAVLVGTSENVEAVRTMAELAGRFDLESTSRSAARFDPDDLVALNRTLLHDMPFADVRDRLAAMGVFGDQAAPFWLAVPGNVDRLGDAVEWWRVLRQGPGGVAELSEEDRQFVRDAFELLPPEPWDRDVWRTWTAEVKERSGRKGKALFAPLRLALTGLPSGPELADLMTLLGREEMLARRP